MNGLYDEKKPCSSKRFNEYYLKDPSYEYYLFLNSPTNYSRKNIYYDETPLQNDNKKLNIHSQPYAYQQQLLTSANGGLKDIAYSHQKSNNNHNYPSERNGEQFYSTENTEEKNLNHSFLRQEKRRKSSAFKSLQSFIKKRLGIVNSNNNFDNFNALHKKNSSSSLYDHSNIYSNQNLNTRKDKKAVNSDSLPRAHSFSSSKMCPDTYSNHQDSESVVQTTNTRIRYNSDLNRVRLASSSNYNSNLSDFTHLIYSQCDSTLPIKSTVLSSRHNFPVSQSTRLPVVLSPTKNYKSAVLSPSALSDNIETSNDLEKNVNSKETPCLKGILNHGNTCYMNAILQCLASISRFSEYFVCQKFENFLKNNESKNSVTVVMGHILQCLWFNVNADNLCLKLLKLISDANSHFQLSSQQDAQESLIYVLDKIHEEIKDDRFSRIDPSMKLYKSEEQLANDALRRVSGSDRSAIMDLFRAQFRSSMECSSCGFSNLTFDPYITVSLSLPQTNIKMCTVLFIPFFNQRQIIRYKMNLKFDSHFENNNYFSKGVSSISQIKEQIVSRIGGSIDNFIACQLSSNGLTTILTKDYSINIDDDKVFEYAVIEVPKIVDQRNNDLIVVIVSHIAGYFPAGLRRGLPYVVVLNRQWSYEKITKAIIEKGLFLLQKSFMPVNADFKLLLQHCADGVLCLDHGVNMPMFNECANDKNFDFCIIVEWNLNSAISGLRSDPESIVNDFSLVRDVDYMNGSPVTLLNLLQDYIKTETVVDWKCPKCLNCSGKKELKFHSMPPVLVFHLKRFELLHDAATKKVDTCVQIPLDSLDMSPYISNPDSRYNTLKSTLRKETNGYIYQKDTYESYPLYDLVGIVHHHGERANSGHYTATTRNAIDNRWRNFDDIKVTLMSQTADIRLSNNAYLLFYEQKFLSTESHTSSKPLTTSATLWFSANVPRSVQIYCEKQRCCIHDNLENKTENLRRELDNYNLNDDRSLIKPIYSGMSTFYAGTAVNTPPNLLNGNSNNYSSNRRNSFTSKPYVSTTNDVLSSKKPIYYCCDNNNVKSQLKSYYFKGSDSSPLSRSSTNYLSDSRQSLYQNHQPTINSGIKSSTSTRYIDNVNTNNNVYLPSYDYNSKYFVDAYSTLPTSTKRSKSYQTLSNSVPHSKNGASYNVSSPYSSVYSRNLNNNTTKFGVDSLR